MEDRDIKHARVKHEIRTEFVTEKTHVKKVV